MKLRALGFLLALCLFSVPAQAQTYKCKDDAGITAFQQTPCPQKQGQLEREQETRAAINARCRALKASDTEFFRCGAEVVCERNGAVGETRGVCVRQMREVLLVDAQRREREAAEKQASAAAALAERRTAGREEDIARQLSPVQPNTAKPTMLPLDCLDVSVLMSDMGMGLYDRMAFTAELASQGACQNH